MKVMTSKFGKKAKSKLFNNEEDQMDRMIVNNELKIGSKNTSEAINNLFIDKVKNLTNKIKEQNEDPMIHYNKYIKTPKNF